MAIGDLLNRLESVRRAGQDRWIAKCPAHDDKHPSLSIRALDEGRVLIHCFAECDVEDVLGAVGLDFTDLFPDQQNPGFSTDRDHHAFNARDVLRCLVLEILIVSDCARTVARGKVLREADALRLGLAIVRIARAAELANAF